MLDEPRGHASGAGQEDQRHRSANGQAHRRLDVDKSGCPAGLERHGKAVVAHATAAERRRGKDSIIQTPIGQVDLGLPITARAVNFGLEAERRYLAERREGQPMQFAAAFRLCHDQAPMLGPDPCPRGSPNGFHGACRINFLPAVSRASHRRPAVKFTRLASTSKARRPRRGSRSLRLVVLFRDGLLACADDYTSPACGDDYTSRAGWRFLKAGLIQ